MTPSKQFAALLGFAFVAAWIGFNFGYAVLCLLGAAIGYAVAAFAQGELDLGELQQRVGSGNLRSGGSSVPPPPPAPRRTAPRVR